MSEKVNINELINLVRETNKEFESDIFVPSLQKEVHFKPMNASHLKAIIKTTVEGVFANNVFNQTVFQIISDTIDPSIPVTKITTIDKLYILMHFRVKNVNENINVVLVHDGNEKVESIGLKKHLSKISKLKFDFKEQEIEVGSYKITLGVPTIDQEYLFEKYFDQMYLRKIDENNSSELKKLFAPLFLNEITQYIKYLKIKDQEINFITLSVPERLSIVESLSSSVISAILSETENLFMNKANKILEVEKEIDGEVYKGQIQINPSLFT